MTDGADPGGDGPSGGGGPSDLAADTERVHRFFWYWYEWMASPARRRLIEEVTGLPRSASLLLWKVLFAGPLTVTELARAMGLDKSTISRQLEPLRARGLVVEAPGGHTRRSTVLAITPAGRAVCDRVDALQTGYWSRVLSHLSPAERRTLTASLDALQRAMDAESGTEA
ncbi:MAG TPA: MarR family winged helix-turn-helix transcriptional regulator [Acidimicrobiales bacterium]